MSDRTIDEQLQWLARGPSITVMQYQGYEINEYTFYTRAQDKKSTNQKSGVRIDAIGHDGNKDSYFGVIEEIWKLDYGPLKIPLCSMLMVEPSRWRCNYKPVWNDNSGLQKDWI